MSHGGLYPTLLILVLMLSAVFALPFVMAWLETTLKAGEAPQSGAEVPSDANPL